MLTGGGESAKAPLDATAWQQGRAVRLGTFAQTADGWAAVRDAVVRLQRPPTVRAGRGAADADPEPVALVLAPTGGDELAVALWARRQPGGPVHRPNPARGRAWAHRQGRRAKPDRQEAALVARLGASAPPALAVWQPMRRASDVRAWDHLRRRRDDVADGVRRERQRHEQVGGRPDASRIVQASVQRLRTTVEDELAELERVLAEQVQHPARLQAAAQRLRTVPGVGPRGALPLLVACERSHALAGDQGTAKGMLASGGWDPQPHASGTSSRRRALIARQGDRALPARLYLGALGALRGANPVHTVSQRLVDRGTPTQLALIAAARTLLAWAWVVFISGLPFEAPKTVTQGT